MVDKSLNLKFYMKNAIRVVVLISILLIASPIVQAQTYSIKGGLSMATVLDVDDDIKYSNNYSMNPGFHVGVTIDLPVSGALSFEPGMVFTTKGTKMDDTYQEVGITPSINLYYLDLPLTMKGTYDFSNNLRMFGAAGPYIGVGLKGNIKLDGGDSSEHYDLEWGNDEETDDMKRLEMGLNFAGGVEINSALISLSYDLGLSNILTYKDYGAKMKNRVLKLSVGYLF